MRSPSRQVQRRGYGYYAIDGVELTSQQQSQNTAAAVTIDRDLHRHVPRQEAIQSRDHGFKHNASVASVGPEYRLTWRLFGTPVVTRAAQIKRRRFIERHQLEGERASGWIPRDPRSVQPGSTIPTEIQMQAIERFISLGKCRVRDNQMIELRAFLPTQISQTRGQ